MCSDMTSHCWKNARLLGDALAHCERTRLLACPDLQVHPERAAVAGDHAPDATVAIYPERLARERRADAHLPLTLAQGAHLLGDLANGREHESPRELGGGDRGGAGVHVRAHHDPEARAGVDVDVGIDASLADQAQLRQPLEQWGAYLGALADQDERLAVVQPRGELVDVLDVIVEDSHVVSGEPVEAAQGSQRVEVVVQDRNPHAASSLSVSRSLLAAGLTGAPRGARMDPCAIKRSPASARARSR